MYKGTLEIGGDINSEISLGTDDELLVILNGKSDQILNISGSIGRIKNNNNTGKVHIVSGSLNNIEKQRTESMRIIQK